MCAVLLREAMDRIEICSRTIIGASSGGGARRNNMAALRELASYDPIDTLALRRNIAARLLAAGCYVP